MGKLEDKDAEIERLRVKFQKAREWNQFSEIQIKNLQEIVEVQSDLLLRAAGALENLLPAISEIMKITVVPLIAELRKAAEWEKLHSTQEAYGFQRDDRGLDFRRGYLGFLDDQNDVKKA